MTRIKPLLVSAAFAGYATANAALTFVEPLI